MGVQILPEYTAADESWKKELAINEIIQKRMEYFEHLSTQLSNDPNKQVKFRHIVVGKRIPFKHDDTYTVKGEDHEVHYNGEALEMEYYENPDLRDYDNCMKPIFDKNGEAEKNGAAIDDIYDQLLTLERLAAIMGATTEFHVLGFLHKDLGLRNIFEDRKKIAGSHLEDSEIKIGDFGLTADLNRSLEFSVRRDNQENNPMKWMDPYSMKPGKTSEYNYLTELYGMAKIMLELLSVMMTGENKTFMKGNITDYYKEVSNLKFDAKLVLLNEFNKLKAHTDTCMGDNMRNLVNKFVEALGSYQNNISPEDALIKSIYFYESNMKLFRSVIIDQLGEIKKQVGNLPENNRNKTAYLHMIERVDDELNHQEKLMNFHLQMMRRDYEDSQSTKKDEKNQNSVHGNPNGPSFFNGNGEEKVEGKPTNYSAIPSNNN